MTRFEVDKACGQTPCLCGDLETWHPECYAGKNDEQLAAATARSLRDCSPRAAQARQRICAPADRIGAHMMAATLKGTEMSEFYGNGEDLPLIHPDGETNKEILIGELCSKLDVARLALGRALEMSVVTPAAVAMKNQVRWALDETHPKTLAEQHPNHG